MSDTEAPEQAEHTEPSRCAWARAYARQSLSDWELYTLLVKNNAPRCHQLHYLQMASEKIGKAYRFRDTSTSPKKLLRQHGGFTKFFSAFLLSDRVSQMYESKAQLAFITPLCRQIARELETLAPAADPDKRPANPEYPWRQGSELFVPHDYEFPNLSLLEDPAGRTFLKLLCVAISEFEAIAIA